MLDNGLVRVICDLECLRGRYQVVLLMLSLTSWVAIQNLNQAQSPDFPIRGQNEKPAVLLK